jgi:hypothetical protein
VPTGYLSASDVEALTVFGGYARRHRSTRVLAEFPPVRPDPVVVKSWALPAATFAANWASRVTGMANV